MKAKYIGWSVKGPDVLYWGITYSRKHAIEKHLSDLDNIPTSWSRSLTTIQKKAWAKRKRKGERCVRVQVKEL